MTPLPHDARAERVVLSGLMKEPHLNRRAFVGLSAGDFYAYPHRLVFAAASDLWRAFEPVGLAEVYAELRRRGALADLGPNPAVWLAEVWTEDPTGFWCGYQARRVKRFAGLREEILDARQRENAAMRMVV